MNDLILFGPQGSGKGTQAKLLGKNFGYQIIGTGDLLRAYATRKDALGKKINKIINHGNLVPDADIQTIFKAEVSHVPAKQSVIFDGYPRNLNQAHFLDTLLREFDRPLPKAVFISIPRSVVFDRLASRYVCTNCGTIARYLPGLIRSRACPNCGKQVQTRKDDQPEVIEQRLNHFYSQTFPLVEHYRRLGRLIEINGEATVEQVQTAIAKALGLA